MALGGSDWPTNVNKCLLTKNMAITERLPSAPLTLNSRPQDRLIRASIATVTLPEAPKDFSASAMVLVASASVAEESATSKVKTIRSCLTA